MSDAPKTTRKRRAEMTKDFENGALSFKFSDGNTAGFNVADLFPGESPEQKASAFKSAKLPHIVRCLVVHGLAQKLADAYADPDVTPYAAVQEGWSDLLAGNWSTRGEGGPRITLLAQALSKLFGKTVEESQTWLDSIGLAGGTDEEPEYDKEERKAALKALREDPAVKATITAIEAERAAARAKAASEAAGTMRPAFQMG